MAEDVKVRRQVGHDVRKEMAGILRRRVSTENKQEYDNEKRAKELNRRGFNQEAIAGMMQITEKDAQKMVRHGVETRRGKNMMILDGDV